jgi:hypothetical protein
MMGVVVEAVLEVRPRLAIITSAYAYLTSSPQLAAAHVVKMQANSDALFAILVPEADYVYIEARNKVCVSAYTADASAWCAVAEQHLLRCNQCRQLVTTISLLAVQSIVHTQYQHGWCHQKLCDVY